MKRRSPTSCPRGIRGWPFPAFGVSYRTVLPRNVHVGQAFCEAPLWGSLTILVRRAGPSFHSGCCAKPALQIPCVSSIAIVHSEYNIEGPTPSAPLCGAPPPASSPLRSAHEVPVLVRERDAKAG